MIKGSALNVRNEKLETVHEYVKIIAGGHMNCLFLFGAGGIGKTEVILRTLEDEEVKAVYLNGIATPLELYHYLYDYNGNLIVLDDVEGILNNPKTIAILKAAIYGYKGRRTICYATTSALLRVPEAFEFTGRLIICVNAFPDNPSLEALTRRTICYELRLSLAEKIDLFKQIAEQRYKGISLEKRRQVCSFLIENVDESTKNLSLRELFKSFDIYKGNTDKWRELIREMLSIDEDVRAFLMATKTTEKVSSQINIFREMTGKSRRTFFRIKQRIKGV